jgi:hypothetical protein
MLASPGGYSTIGTLPDTLQMHRANLHNMSNFLALENSVTAATRHSRNVQKFCAVDHVVIWKQFVSMVRELDRVSQLTFSAGNADAACLYLEAKAALVFPKRRRHTRLHARGLDLSGRVKSLGPVLAGCHALLAADARQRQDGLPRGHGTAWWPGWWGCQTIIVGVLVAVLRGPWVGIWLQ